MTSRLCTSGAGSLLNAVCAALAAASIPATLRGVNRAVIFAAGLFVADWNVDDLACVPTLTESLALIADYEAARVASFSPSERRTAVASLVATTAYCARCEHSDALTEAVARPAGAPPAGVPVDGYLGFLAAHGPALLGVDIPGVPALRDE